MTTEKEIESQIKRLNGYMERLTDGTRLDFFLGGSYGKQDLYINDGGRKLSSGDTKKELYDKLNFANELIYYIFWAKEGKIA